jgi:uncharacterized protein DUF6364
MKKIDLTIDEDVLRKARQYADEHGTTLEALIAEHLAVLADRAGRRLTLREQTYVDCRPSEQVIEALQAEGLGSEREVR